jgi:hypothetical protein
MSMTIRKRAARAVQPFPRFRRVVWSQELEDKLNEVRLAERSRITHILAVYASDHHGAAVAIANGPTPKFFLAR